MQQQLIQKLRNLPIEGVAERLGFRVTHHHCLCPYHEDTHPSLSFNLRKNSFHCFVCGKSGSTIDLVMQRMNLSFPNACRWLANEANIIIDEYQPAPIPPKTFDATRYERFFINPSLSHNARSFLFGERQLDARVVRWCRLTSWQDRNGREWLQIPYYDTNGKLIGVQNRNLQKGASPRFKFPYGSQCGIYNLPVIGMLHEGEPLYITEGCSDCWAMLSAGHKAIAIPSATLLKPSDIDILNSLQPLGTTFHMYPDCDAPGERLFLQLRDLLPNLTHHQLPAGCKDFSDYYRTTKGGGA